MEDRCQRRRWRCGRWIFNVTIPFSVDERDESIEEIGGPPRRTPAERLGGEDDEEAA
jgi:hypothetical protein